MKVPHENKNVQVIGPQSPLGKALLGKQVGDEISLHLPSGMQLLDILSVD
jgi:transcription elongation GreA/GreB family factor